MIPFNFIYFKPESLEDAVNVFIEQKSMGKTAMYYAGGSEIISMCRVGSIQPDAIIDIKGIPDCRVLSVDNQKLNIGSVCTLNEISESKLFPLMRLSCGRIADHTNQCRITLGGNLSGTIIYRETSLPLLVSDAEITLFGPDGKRTVPFQSIFDERLQLAPGEFVVQVHVPEWALSSQYYHLKKTANEKIDYPLVSIAAILHKRSLRIAFSGVCRFPFRSIPIEDVLNDQTKSIKERARIISTELSETVYNDAEASGEYRLFVLKNTLEELLEAWDDGKI